MNDSPASHRARPSGRAALALFALSGLLACGGDGGTDPSGGGSAAVAQVALSVREASVGVGRTLTIEAQALGASGNVMGGGASWSSADPSIATVAGGVVTGRAPGTTEIRATVGGATSRATITVGEPVAAVDIVTAAAGGMPVGATMTLRAAMTDAAGATLTGRQVTWSGGDAAIARLDARAGTLTAIANGTTRLVATSEGRADTVEVRVVAPPAIERGMAAMEWNTCALTALGEAWCWGALGENSTTNYNVIPGPRRAGGVFFRTITAGGTHACGLTADSLAYCWGSPGNGRLGDGRAYSQYAPLVNEPVPVAGGLRFAAISAGAHWTLGLTADGRLYAWGDNTGGRLGDGTTTHRGAPVPIGGALRFRLVDAHYSGNLALSTANQLYTWGGYQGAALASPTLVSSQDVARNATFVTLSASSWDAVALTASGEAYGWEQGNGNSGLYIGSLTPVRLQAGYTFRRAEMGENAWITAITTGGQLVSWGSAYRGYLGNGQYATGIYDDPRSTTPVAPTGGRSYTDFALGNEHVAAIDATGEAWHWGFSQIDGGFATGERYGIYATPKAGVPARILADFSNAAPTVTLTRGARDSVIVPVRRTGGSFRRSGAGVGLPPYATATVEGLPAGVSATIEHVVQRDYFEFEHYIVRLTASSSVSGGSHTLALRLTAPNAAPAVVGMALEVDAPGAPVYDLVCTSAQTPASFPSGYHCMDNGSGQFAPAKYALPQLAGSWVEQDYGVCVDYNTSTGISTARYKAGLGGGSTTVTTGKFGAISRRSGELEQAPNDGWYLFTGALDAQTQLMTFYPAQGAFSGGNFTRGSCPW